MIKLLRIAALHIVLLCSVSSASGAGWQVVHMERGCASLKALYSAYPQVEGAETPEEMVRALRKVFSNVKSEPFVKAAADPRFAGDNPGRSNSLSKFYDASNAILITWGEDGEGDGFLLYTDRLCTAIYGASKR